MPSAAFELGQAFTAATEQTVVSADVAPSKAQGHS